MKPSIGRIVHYKLSVYDLAEIVRRRHELSRAGGAHLEMAADQVLPMLIVKVHGDHPNSAVNGHVFLDGDDTLFVSSRLLGEAAGTWSWPAIVPPATPVGVAYGDRI